MASVPFFVQAQIDQYNTINQAYDYFRPGFLNVYSIVFVNTSFEESLEVYKQTAVHQFAILNHANAALQKTCAYLLEQPVFTTELDRELAAQIARDLQNWKKQNQYNNFLGAHYFSTFYECCRRLGLPLIDLIDTCDEQVKPAFIDIPAPLKSILRIGVGIPEQYITDFFLAFQKNVMSRPEIGLLVEKVEISVFDPKFSQDGGFPSFKIFINYEHLAQQNGQAASYLQTLIGQLEAMLPEQPKKLTGDYQHALRPWITLSQGYVNYKKMLDMLGLIDLVYDRERQYAYLNQAII